MWRRLSGPTSRFVVLVLAALAVRGRLMTIETTVRSTTIWKKKDPPSVYVKLEETPEP